MLSEQCNGITIRNSVKLIIYIFLLVALMQANTVWAHASLVKSDPPRRASLSKSPAQIQLWFNEEIETAYASVAVLDSNGKTVSVDEPKAVEEDPKSVILAMPELEPGSYKVQFRVLSVDGHVVESDYSFRIKNN
ncbi:MAG: copper resistance protein CopC [Burkholderiales bacterium]|nr:copper resistance protein CopC [Burkholderiales bacterium]